MRLPHLARPQSNPDLNRVNPQISLFLTFCRPSPPFAALCRTTRPALQDAPMPGRRSTDLALESPSHWAGVAYALSAELAFSLMAACVHGLAGAASFGQLLLARGIFSMLVLYPAVHGRIHELWQPEARWLWMRSFAGTSAVLCYYWTIQHTNLATSAAFAHTAPAFVVIYSFLLREEPPSATRVAVITLMMVGVFLVNMSDVTGLGPIVATVGMLGAASAGMAYISLRRAAQKYSANLVVFSLGAFSTAAGVGVMLVSYLQTQSGTPASTATTTAAHNLLALAQNLSLFQYSLFFATMLLAVGGQLLRTRTYLHLDASMASALGLLSLPIGVAFDAAFFDKLPSPDDTVGYALVMAGGVALNIEQQRRASAPAPASFDIAPDDVP